MKIVGRVLEEKLQHILNVDELQFGFMPEKVQLMLILC